MLYWFEPILDSGDKTSPHYRSQPNFFSIPNISVFSSFSTNAREIVAGAFCYPRTSLARPTIAKTRSPRFSLTLVVAALLGTFHYFLTVPLFKIHFSPTYISVFSSHTSDTLARLSWVGLQRSPQKFWVIGLVPLILWSHFTSFAEHSTRGFFPNAWHPSLHT